MITEHTHGHDTAWAIEEVYEFADSMVNHKTTLPCIDNLSLDKVNRVQLPTSIINKYQISKNVALIGVGDHFEIWSLEAYKAYEQENSKEFENIAETLKDGE